MSDKFKLAYGKFQGLSWGEIIKAGFFIVSVAITLYFTVQENTKALKDLKEEVVKLRKSNISLQLKQIQLETKYDIQIANMKKDIDKLDKK